MNMLNGHIGSGGRIEYSAATCLFPVDELEATVRQYRDAEVALDGVDGPNVIVVAPTGLTTSSSLSQRALTAICVDSLTSTVRAQIAAVLDDRLDVFELIQIGKWNCTSTDHSGAEFADA